MGANDKKKPVKIELTEEQQVLFAEALGTIQQLVDDIGDVGAPIREWALGLTKLEEAEMWIDRGFAMLGIEPQIPGDEDDEESEDDESDDESEEE